jgi:hypothetical protein
MVSKVIKKRSSKLMIVDSRQRKEEGRKERKKAWGNNYLRCLGGLTSKLNLHFSASLSAVFS